MSIESDIKKLIAEEVERALEGKLPEIIRALGIKEAEPERARYVDALGVAEILGMDVSTPENIVKAKRHVYHLAAQKKIPSIRISDRNLKFDRAKVLKTLEAKENKAA